MYLNPYHDTIIINDIRIVTPLCLERSAGEATEWERKHGTDMYAVAKDFKVSFSVNVNPSNTEYVEEQSIVVPAGFLTDMASVPRFCRMLFSRIGRHSEAAVVHDYLYAIHHYLADSQYEFYLIDKKKRERAYRAFSDWVFLEIMNAMGVKKRRSLPAFWAVRLFGVRSWRNKRSSDFRKV